MSTGYLPVRTSAYESTEYQTFLASTSTDAKKAAIIAAANAAYTQSGFMCFDPAFIGSSKARTKVGSALERIMLGDGNIQGALDEAYDQSKVYFQPPEGNGSIGEIYSRLILDGIYEGVKTDIYLP